jgi:hypothetical protein
MSLGYCNLGNMGLQYALFISLLTARYMDLLDQLPVIQLINICICCYGTLGFIIIFTRSHQWITCWANWIQSICSQLVSLRWALILSSQQYLCPAVVSSNNVNLRLISHREMFTALYGTRRNYRVRKKLQAGRQRQRLALSIGPNWVDSVWRRRQNAVSKTSRFQ